MEDFQLFQAAAVEFGGLHAGVQASCVLFAAAIVTNAFSDNLYRRRGDALTAMSRAGVYLLNTLVMYRTCWRHVFLFALLKQPLCVWAHVCVCVCQAVC